LRGGEHRADFGRHGQFFSNLTGKAEKAILAQFDTATGQHGKIILVLAADQHMAIGHDDPGDTEVETAFLHGKAQDIASGHARPPSSISTISGAASKRCGRLEWPSPAPTMRFRSFSMI